MTRTDIEEIVLSVLENPLMEDKPRAAKMIGSLLFSALGQQVAEDRTVVVLNGRKMRVKSQAGPIVQLEDVGGSGFMVVATIASLEKEVVGGSRALAEAIEALGKQ